MSLRHADPVAYFNEWFSRPVILENSTVVGVIDGLNNHSMAQDETGQDYVMPAHRYRQRPGWFRIYGENQDTYYCFVYEGDEYKIDPPVYLEFLPGFDEDYGLDPSDIIDGNHTLVASRFSDFLWYLLAHHACARLESGGQFVDGVSGAIFREEIPLDGDFVNPLGKEFPAGYTCFVADDVVYMPGWGAAFRTSQAREQFLSRYQPTITQSWE